MPISSNAPVGGTKETADPLMADSLWLGLTKAPEMVLLLL